MPPTTNTRPSGSVTAGPNSLSGTSTSPSGVGPEFTQMPLAGTYRSACGGVYVVTLSTDPSWSSTQLASFDI